MGTTVPDHEVSIVEPGDAFGGTWQWNTYFNLIETQARHIARCLGHAKGKGATLVEVKREANARDFAEKLRRRYRFARVGQAA